MTPALRSTKPLQTDPRHSPSVAIMLKQSLQLSQFGYLQSSAVVDSDASVELIACGLFPVRPIPQPEEELFLATDPICSPSA